MIITNPKIFFEEVPSAWFRGETTPEEDAAIKVMAWSGMGFIQAIRHVRQSVWLKSRLP
jgi:hypothetical protein